MGGIAQPRARESLPSLFSGGASTNQGAARDGLRDRTALGPDALSRSFSKALLQRASALPEGERARPRAPVLLALRVAVVGVPLVVSYAASVCRGCSFRTAVARTPIPQCQGACR